MPRTIAAHPFHAARRARARRLTSFEMTMLALTLVALVATAIATSGSRPIGTMETARVHVKAGDTLWSIASSHPVEGLDTAQTTDVIAELNGLGSPVLVAGSTIRVPLSDQGASLAMR